LIEFLLYKKRERVTKSEKKKTSMCMYACFVHGAMDITGIENVNKQIINKKETVQAIAERKKHQWNNKQARTDEIKQEWLLVVD